VILSVAAAEGSAGLAILANLGVGVEHLLIGLLREGEGVGYGVLTSLGVTVDQARAELKRHLTRVSMALAGGQTVSDTASDASNDQPGSTETAA